MDGILQNRQLSEMIPFDLSEQVLLFPVRHHSPACSFQLVRTIQAYQPEIILVEGPENANFLIPVLTEEGTELPAAIYYFYKDKKQLVSEEAGDYQCYYPFLYSSPEYNALMEGKKYGIPAKFIDLPYSEILIHTEESRGMRKSQEKHSYSDDSHLVQSRFYAQLCQKTGLRSFEEFWEKYFEIEGIRKTPEEFVRQMHTYCTLTRQETPAKQLEADGTLAREQHMACRIREAMAAYQKILVVTGGFHSPGLHRLLQAEKPKPVKLHRIPDTMQNCYPMAYSYEAADALSGYASGMLHPAYYDSICQALLSGEDPAGVYQDAALRMLTETARRSAEKDIPVSTADVTAAYSLAAGLAAMRGSGDCGMAELYDGVTAAYIKGEKTAASSLPLEILHSLAVGNKVGMIRNREHTAPLILDFEKQCRYFRLKNSSVRESADIPLFAKEKSMEESRFFHRMRFLGTDFAKMEKGPDLHRCKDRNRVREQWSYCRKPCVDTVLIERTPDGSTLAEACLTRAKHCLTDKRRCDAAAQTAVDCFLMGLPFPDKRLAEKILDMDGDFFSIGTGLHYYQMLYELQNLYGFSDASVLRFLEQCFGKLLVMLPSMANVPPESAGNCIRIMRELYGVSGIHFRARQEEFRQALLHMTERTEKEPSVFGAAMGLLYAMDSRLRTEAECAMQGFLKGSLSQKKEGAAFLRGLFETARDIALTDESFLKMTDELITNMEFEDFAEVLPSLRLAFSFFTPSEIQATAKTAAAFHGESKEKILYTAAADEPQTAFGRQLDAEICRLLKGEMNHAEP